MKTSMFVCLAVLSPVMAANADSVSVAPGSDLFSVVTSHPEATEFVLPAGTYPSSAEIVLSSAVTIRGADGTSCDDVIISGDNTHKMFTLADAGARLYGLTIRGGFIQKDASPASCGAAVWLSAGAVVSNCVMTANHCSGRYAHGVVYLDNGALVTHCRIVDNTYYRGKNGAGSCRGLIVYGRTGVLRNSLVARNLPTAEAGDIGDSAIVYGNGGDTSFQIVNCTIAGNAVPDLSAAATAGVYGNYNVSVRVVNTVIVGNKATSPELAVRKNTINFYNCATDSPTLYEDAETMSFKGCVVADTSAFVDAENGDYSLAKDAEMLIDAGSCSINIGTAAKPKMVDVEVDAVDLKGEDRILGDEVDMGCYEFNPNVGPTLTVYHSDTDWWYAPVALRLTASLSGSIGDDVRYYWDVDGDGRPESVTTQNTLSYSFAAGSYPVVVSVSNLVEGVGVTGSCDSPIEVLPRPTVTVTGSTGADIQAAIDMAERGTVVVIPRGTYHTAGVPIVVLKEVELRGETGDPNDVVIANNHPSNRVMNVDGGPHCLIHSLTLADGRSHGDIGNATGPFLCTGLMIAAASGFDKLANTSDRPDATCGGCVSNVIVRGCSGFGKYSDTSTVYLKGPKATFTHSIISNCQGEADWSSGLINTLALFVGGGAEADNVLVCDNKFSDKTYGGTHGMMTVTVSGPGSVLRYSSVLGNAGTFCGGVNVYNGGRFEHCVIAGNTARENGGVERRNVWTSYGYDENGRPSWDEFKRDGSFTTAMAEENERAATAEIYEVQGTNAVDVANCLNETTVYSEASKLVRNLARGDYRLPPSSPARDVVDPKSAGEMPATDVLRHPRLSGGLYDLGALEAQAHGLLIFLK